MDLSKKIKLDSHCDFGNETDLNNDSYFRCYDDIRIHAEMLQDKVRTKTYKWAILKNFKSFYGKVILDVGCGTGILSMFCVQAGAKKVYAVDGSSIVYEAMKVIKSNNMQDKITVIHGKIEEIKIPEKVDVIVSEWMGYMLLYESMLPSVLYARDNFLKPNGLMFPTEAKIYMAFGVDEEHNYNSCDLWEDLGDEYKLNLSVLKSYAKKNSSEKVCIKEVLAEDVMSHPYEILHMNFSKSIIEDCLIVQSDFKLLSFGSVRIQCFVIWFDVMFPSDIRLTTSPYKEITHWQQCLMYLKEPIDVEQDSVISGSIKIQPNNKNKRFLDVTITYKKDNEEEETSQKFIMDGFIT